ncbi:transposase [Luteimonas sp. R10]
MQKRQRFTAEFKREAVRLLKARDRPAAAIARELGISSQPALHAGAGP